MRGGYQNPSRRVRRGLDCNLLNLIDPMTNDGQISPLMRNCQTIESIDRFYSWCPTESFPEYSNRRAAHKKNVLRSSLSSEDVFNMLSARYERPWNVFMSRNGSKAYRLKHHGRYIRRPPIAQQRLTRVGNAQVEYSAKDTKNKRLIPKR
jgi:hypothetical protein